MFNVGDKVVNNTTLSSGSKTFRVGQAFTVERYSSVHAGKAYVRHEDSGYTECWYDDLFELLLPPTPPAPVALDGFHATAMIKMVEAFKTFNESIWTAMDECEALDVIVTCGGDNYARLFYADGEAYVEPIFPVIRPIAEM